MPVTLSPLATAVPRLRDVADRTAPVYGVAVHTTGSGIVDLARNLKVDPLEKAVAYYLGPENYFAHYVIGYGGETVQVADEKEKALHIGFPASDRAAYLDGSWKRKLPAEVVSLWQARWAGFASPAHLFPGPSPNNVLIGIELLPVASDFYGVSAADGDLLKIAWAGGNKLRYTIAQHLAVAWLSQDIGKRHGLPHMWYLKTGRFCTHEDVNPIARHTKKPPACWDPGVLRDSPWLDWAYILGLLSNF